MAVTVRMACGCALEWTDGDDLPLCKSHNERRVQQVNSAVPRILAVDCKAEGPLVKRG